MSLWQPGRTLEEVEKDVILQAYQFYHQNKVQTSRSLGISVRTLDNKLAKYEGRPIIEDIPKVQVRK